MKEVKVEFVDSTSYVQNISAEKKATLKRAWFPQKDVNKKRPQSPCTPPRKRPGEAVRVAVVICGDKTVI